jgi:hypothetical protein
MMMQRIEEGALAKIFDFVLGISLLLASKKAAHSSCWWMIVQPICLLDDSLIYYRKGPTKAILIESCS